MAQVNIADIPQTRSIRLSARSDMSDVAPSRNTRVLSWIALAALLGIGVFAFLAWRSISVEQAQPADALRRFSDVRHRLASTEPMLRIDAAGAITRREAPAETEATHLTWLRVLAYRVPEQRLVRADVPFWYLKVKGPAVQYALRGTGLDLERLGVTPADLERYGACVVLDETRANGDRLLVWTE
jgi:hypothetical protein